MKAVILGLTGHTLSHEERVLFTKHQPLGFILFRRNCQSHQQIQALIQDLRATVNHLHVPILIDQEGGRVRRLVAPTFHEYPAAATFGQYMAINPSVASNLLYENYTLIAQELYELGINANCAPCADIAPPHIDHIIGDRAFSEQPNITTTCAIHAINAHIEQNIMPIIKHLPGHGCASQDSHYELPIIKKSLDDLINTDFMAFKNILSSYKYHPWGMTGHLLYPHIDAHLCATESPTIINDIIRGIIGFNGFLISDCLAMQALQGSYTQRVTRALHAGCDAVLYCPAHLNDMEEVCHAAQTITPDAYQRYMQQPISITPDIHITRHSSPLHFFDQHKISNKINDQTAQRYTQLINRIKELGIIHRHDRTATIGEHA